MTLCLRFVVPRVLMFVCAAASAAGNVKAPPPGFTDKEIAQGYSDRVVLAKPRAQHRATCDAAESLERVQVREKLPRFGDLRIIEIPAGETADSVITRLQATGRYEFVERDHIEKHDATPNDPSFAVQWSLNNTGQLTGSTAGADIRAVAAWDVIREAPGVVVAVIDGGINPARADLTPNLWRNPAPTIGDINGVSIIDGVRTANIADEGGHGTHVAGIIGATGNNGINITGVAWRVQLMILKNSGASGTSQSSDSALCLDYAISKGARIVNCSFGGIGHSRTFFTVLQAARDAGVIVVCSSGNDGLNNDTFPHYPANYLLDNVVSVGNSQPNDTPSLSSDYGGLVDLHAPGTSISSLDLTATGLTVRSGTSMAAPHVTGALALMRAQFPSDTYRQLINRLLRGTDRLARFSAESQSGGRLNLQRAVTGTVNRPFNDEFAARSVLLYGQGAAVRANNTGATAETGEPAHAGSAPTNTLWWQWTASATGTATISTVGSDYDTVLAVYTGTTLANLTPVAANDDAVGLTTSTVSFPIQVGTNYHIAVGGKGGAAGFTYLRVGASAANDTLAGAVALPVAESVQIAGTTLHAGAQPGEPGVLGRPPLASVWYRWTAPRSGRFQVAAYSVDIDTVVGVFTGNEIGALTSVAGGDDTGVTGANADALASFTAVAGVTYAIKVDSQDPLRTGTFTLTLTDSLWQFSTEGAITGAPAVGADGTVYIGGGAPDRHLYAVRPDGTLRWRFEAGGTVDNCSPAIGADGTIYFGASDGQVTALTPAGAVRWQRSIGTGTAGVSPAIGIDGTVHTHGIDGTLHALDGATGAVRWRVATGATNFASPVIAPDGTIYQMAGVGGLVALTSGGTIKWRFTVATDTFSTPALDAAGNIYFTTYTTSRLYSVRPDGVERWNFAAASGSLTSTSPVLSADGSTAYFGSNNRVFHAVNTADGALRWRVTLGGNILASTAAVDATGAVYVGAYDGRLYSINSVGTVKRSWDTGSLIRSSPVIAGRTLYVGSVDQKLYAFDIGAEAAGGTWAQYRQNPGRTGRVEGGNFAITLAPPAVSVIATQPFDVAVGVAAPGAVTFQWSKDGVAIPGATYASVPFAAATAADAGSYTVAITSGGRTITSTPAVVTVVPLQAPRFANFSVRAAPGIDPRGLIVGFNVGAGTAKPVLMRGVGPTLATFGLTTALADPSLELRSGATVVLTNNDWAGDAAVVANSARVGAFALPAASRDAAVVSTLNPGAYSLRVLGVGGATGIALAEVYDLDPADAEARGASRLRNISARAQVGLGGEVLVGGITITGNVAKRVLIRAVGGQLASFGITGVLADPVLEVYNGTTLIGRNDDWGGTAALVAAFAQANAFPFTSLSSLDSALVLTLQPGIYSARVMGFGTATGVALLEFYELP